MLENCFLSFSDSKSSYMKWCSFSYGCYKTSSQDHPIGLEFCKFCLQEHIPYWYSISEVNIELSQAKHVGKPLVGRMRDNIFSLTYVSAHWRNLENDSYTKQTKALWHSLERLCGMGRYDFSTPVYITTLEILNERKILISFSRRFMNLELKSPRSSTQIHFWDKKSVYL